jgi:hypothetical protein
MSNAFPLVSIFDGIHFGIGFDPLICTTNHSCDPNASLAFNQPRYEIRALKTINAGEEIFIQYTEPTNPLNVRQAQLKAEYLFTCQCTKCRSGVLEADQYASRPEELDSEYCELADKLASKHESRLSGFLMPGGDAVAQRRVAALQAEAYAVLDKEEATVDDLQGAIRMCMESKMWRWTRQPVPQLCRRLFIVYLESGLMYRAFRLGVKLHLEILPVLYPQEFSTNRLTHALAVSTVVNVLCGPEHQEIYEDLAQGGLELRIIYFGFLFYVHDYTPQMFGASAPFRKVVESTYTQILAGVKVPERKIRDKIQEIWPSLEVLAHSIKASDI